MDGPKRPSGGKRATEAKRKRREEAARRVAVGESTGLLAPAAVQMPDDLRDASAWLQTRLIALGIAAENDPGLEPPQQRREAREHYAAAGKLCDSAKLRAELDELYAMLEKAPPEDATPLRRSEDQRPPAPAAH
jgi:hypothetical protein